MQKRAKLFKNGASQAVRLPKEFRFKGDEVLIEKQGDKLILSPAKKDWEGFIERLTELSGGFIEEIERQPPEKRDWNLFDQNDEKIK